MDAQDVFQADSSILPLTTKMAIVRRMARDTLFGWAAWSVATIKGLLYLVVSSF